MHGRDEGLAGGLDEVAAARAASSSSARLDLPDRLEGGDDRLAGLGPGVGGQGVDRAAEVARVGGGEHRAEDGDAEGTADLADRVVDRGPAPAFSRGTTDMIDSVAGAITAPMPRPCTERTTTSSQTGEARSSSWTPAKDSAMSRNPLAQTALAPNRSASRSCAAP